MTKKSPCALGVAVLLSWLIAIPGNSWAAPQAAGQHAGEVSRFIPAANIARSGKTIPAAAKTACGVRGVCVLPLGRRHR